MSTLLDRTMYTLTHWDAYPQNQSGLIHNTNAPRAIGRPITICGHFISTLTQCSDVAASNPACDAYRVCVWRLWLKLNSYGYEILTVFRVEQRCRPTQLKDNIQNAPMCPRSSRSFRNGFGKLWYKPKLLEHHWFSMVTTETWLKLQVNFVLMNHFLVVDSHQLVFIVPND